MSVDLPPVCPECRAIRTIDQWKTVGNAVVSVNVAHGIEVTDNYDGEIKYICWACSNEFDEDDLIEASVAAGVTT